MLTVISRGQHFIPRERQLRGEGGLSWHFGTLQNYLSRTDQRVETEQRDSAVEQVMDGLLHLQKNRPSKITAGKYSVKIRQHYGMNGPFTVMGSKIKPTAVQPGTLLYSSKKHRTIHGVVPCQA